MTKLLAVCCLKISSQMKKITKAFWRKSSSVNREWERKKVPDDDKARGWIFIFSHSLAKAHGEEWNEEKIDFYCHSHSKGNWTWERKKLMKMLEGFNDWFLDLNQIFIILIVGDCVWGMSHTNLKFIKKYNKV